MKDPPCDGEGLVGDFGPTVRDRELIFAEERITLPGKDGVVAETTQDGVTERQEKNLQHRQCAMSTTNSGHSIIYWKSSFDSIKTNQQIPTWHNSTNQSSDEPEPDSFLSLLIYLFMVFIWYLFIYLQIGLSCLPFECQQTAWYSASSSSEKCPGPRAVPCPRMCWWRSDLNCGPRLTKLLLHDHASNWPAALCLRDRWWHNGKIHWQWNHVEKKDAKNRTTIKEESCVRMCPPYLCQSTWWCSQPGPRGTLWFYGGWKPEQCRPVLFSAPDEICPQESFRKKKKKLSFTGSGSVPFLSEMVTSL